MRPLARFAAAPLLIVAAACSDGRSETLVDASLERDLKLASTETFALAPAGANSTMALETAPPTTEVAAPKPRRATTGPRRVRSPQPTVAAAPEVRQAAEPDAGDVMDIITQPSGEAAEGVAVADADAGAVTDADADAGVALPRPVPVVIELPAPGGSGDYDRGRGGSDGGWGWGGVVIRGGDVDDCRIDQPRRTRRPVGRPSGGLGGSRAWPAGNRGQTRTDNSEGRRAWPVSRGSARGGSSSGGGPVWGRARQ
ncbi:MAG TPA: hypothetical protein VFT96_02070 [Gemmatimonadaceae bacterium]|nr:hypothetical protein [Gemmatimonadaceae bacterium]